MTEIPLIPDIHPKQRLAALAIAQGLTQKEAAKQSGVTRRTVERWVAHPDFQKLVWHIQNDFYEAAVGRAVAAASKAAQTLETIMDSSESPPSVRVQAAQALLGFADKMFKQKQLESRIEELEAYATNRENKAA